MKKVFSFLVVFSVAVAARSTTLANSQAYVTNGLVGHYDGIDNAGIDDHDPDATAWKDLAGTLGDGTLGAGIGWNGNCWTNAVDGRPVTIGSAFSSLVATKTFTIDLVLKPDAVNVRRTLLGNYSSGQNFNLECASDARIRCYYGGNPDWYPGAKLAAGQTTALALVTTPAAQTFYTNGVSAATRTGTIVAALTAGTSTIVGGELNRTSMAFRGAYYALRIYNRALSADEIALNHIIDSFRFDGVAAPDGYAFDDAGQPLIRVDAAGTETSPVSFDGATFYASTNAWFAAGTETTVFVLPGESPFAVSWTVLAYCDIYTATSVTFAAFAPAALSADVRAPATKTWRGATSALASLAANWAEGALPASGDAVVLDADSRSMTWDLDDIAPGSWTQTVGYTGTVTFLTGRADDSSTRGLLSADGETRELRVGGDVTLTGGVWTHQQTPSLTSASTGWIDGRGVYRLVARVGGDLQIGAGTAIDVSTNGFATYQGPGSGGSYGASHGGLGGSYWESSATYVNRRLTYGSVKAPKTIGSGNYSRGGGGIQMTVDGKTVLHGALRANGQTYLYYCGAGGGIFLVTGSLEGTGAIQARGGIGTTAGSAGGGRIAVVLTDTGATFDAYTGDVSAAQGNANRSYAGTVYLETPADNGKGTLLIKGVGSLDLGQRGFATALEDPADDYSFSTIILTNNVLLGICSNCTVSADRIIGTGSEISVAALFGGALELPDDYVLTNCSVRAWQEGSVLRSTAGETGTIAVSPTAHLVIDVPVSLPGTLHVLSGGIVRHTGSSSSDYGYRLNLTIPRLTVDVGGQITADGYGYATAKGPGAPLNDGLTVRAGSHAGLAHDVGAMEAYGSIARPVTYGSGGQSGEGGGAIHLVVTNLLTLNGNVTADGRSYYRSGAGGSVWIEAAKLVGTGAVSAKGGAQTTAVNCGGGGRIAITLTGDGSTFADFDGSISANGGANTSFAAGAGTVYLREPDQAENDGTLILDSGIATYADNLTPISPGVTETEIGHLVITNGARLLIRQDQTLTVRREIENCGFYAADANGEAGDDAHAAGTVLLEDASVSATLLGTNVFTRLCCTTPGKTVRFGALTNTAATNSICGIAPGGSFEIAGDAESPVYLRSTADGVFWLLDIRAGASASVAYADVQDSDARPGNLVSADSTTVGSHLENWVIASPINPGDRIVWTGAESSAWANPGNWDLLRIPVVTDDVLLPGSVSTPAELGATTTLNRLTVESGADLNLCGFSIKITNIFACAGALTASGTETVAFSGSASFAGGSFIPAASTVVLVGGAGMQSFDPAGLAFYKVVFAGSGAGVTLADGFAADVFSCEKTAAFEIVFAAGETVTAREIVLTGVADGTAALALKSSSVGTSWTIHETAKLMARGVVVSDSTALGTAAVAEAPSADGGNNVNWRFGLKANAWTGAAGDKAWTNAANWAGGEVPYETTRVVFNAASEAVLAAPATVRAVTVEDLAGGEMLLLGAGALTALENVEALAGGRLSLGVPLAVGGQLFVRSGAALTHPANGATDLGYGLDVAVAGDALVEVDGAIDAECKGYNPGKGPGYLNAGAVHGGRYTAVTPAPYGSILHPITLGSGGGADHYKRRGGGRIRVQVDGTFTVDGMVYADSARTSSTDAGWYSAAGGSVWVTAGVLKGGGIICADGGRVVNTSVGTGGRVAVYTTSAPVIQGAGGFTGVISAYGGRNFTSGSLPQSACGSVYLQPAGTADGAGTVIVSQGGGVCNAGYGMDLPVTVDGDGHLAYARATVVAKEGGAIYLTRDVTVGDMDIPAGCRINLNGYTLRILSRAHRTATPDGNGGYEADWDGTVSTGTGGKIVWGPVGLVLYLR